MVFGKSIATIDCWDFGQLVLKYINFKLQCDDLMFFYLLYTTCLIIGSYSLAVTFGLLTMKQLRRDAFLQSQRTRKLQTQFNKILLIQVGVL